MGVAYYPVSIKRSRTENLKKEGIYVFEADINERNFLNHILKEYKVTHILALAAQAGVRYAAKDPASYVSSNVSGFVNILEAARLASPMPRIVYASSSSVYGLRGRPDMAAFSFTQKIDNGEAVKIFQGPGGSELERDFTYIDDIVKGTLAALDKVTPSSKDTAMCKTYNLGNEDPVTVSYLVDCLENSIGKKAVRSYVPMPPTGDVLKTSADVSKAAEDLGYSPSTPLATGIDNFIRWHREYFKDGVADDVLKYVPY